MKHTSTHNMLAPEQYSVTGKKCISHVVNKTILFDNVRYAKSCLCMTSCDLKSCYNRIAHAPAMIAARSMGIEIRE